MTCQTGRSLLDFAVSTAPDARRLMALLRAFADESGKASDPKIRYISMGSVIGTDGQWDDFSQRWRAMLAKHEIPYLHMKEVVGALHSKKGVFAKFANPSLLYDLLEDAASCILDTALYCCAQSIVLDDLKRVLRRHGMKADPYSFTLYQTVISLGTWALNTYPDDPSFQLVLDRIEGGHQKAAEAEKLYNGDVFASWRGWPAVTPLPKNDRRGSREMVELQVADAVAWSVRNQLDHVGTWVRDIKPTLGPLDSRKWWDSLFHWLVARNKELAPDNLVRINFLSLWARLMDAKALKYYIYDEERLENHIFKHRDTAIDPVLKGRTIQRAGRAFPLTP